MAAPTSRCKGLKESLANGEPSIHGPRTAVPIVAIHVRKRTDTSAMILNGSVAPPNRGSSDFLMATEMT